MRLKPYLVITRNGVMSALAYRGHFFFMLAGTIIYLVVTRFLWQAVYSGGGSIAGLAFSQAYLYVGISMSLVGIMGTGTDWQLHNVVVSGEIPRFLTKPLDFPGQIFAGAFSDGIVNCVAIGLPSLVLAFLLSGAGLPSIANILLFVIAVAMGFLLNYLIDFLTGLSVFLTQSISGISIAKETTIMVLSGALVPLPFYPKGIREVLEWLPFQALYNAPARILADGAQGLSEALPFLLKQAAWLLVFYLLVRLCFSAALKKLVVNGG
jgi:ABC-2 type transport system permease protein